MILKISLPMMVSGSILLLMGNIDSFMIGLFSENISDVGVYNIAVSISTVTSITKKVIELQELKAYSRNLAKEIAVLLYP